MMWPTIIPTKKTTKKASLKAEQQPRKYLSQSDVPAYPLAAAIRVAKALADNYGKNPTKPLRVAQAMELSPGSSNFRMLCGASIAYGLTEGGYNSELISLTALGKRVIAPTSVGDDDLAMRAAMLAPRVNKEFLTKYNGSRLPPVSIAKNVLEEMGVPSGRTSDVFSQIIEGARDVGFTREVKGQDYVDLDASGPNPVSNNGNKITGGDDVGDDSLETAKEPSPGEGGESLGGTSTTAVRNSGRVFITHGRNKEIVVQLKDLLTFGGFSPIVATENETSSKPVPDKVLDDMRSCGAAIIHVGTEMRVVDTEGKEHKILNQNVLIEIGAAMALYGRKFILLVEKGASLPSNLQGLYEVRYEGEKLDYDATMKLLKAFNDFRS